jgi:type I restriction-modification system DNA methylase subunit
LTQKHALILQAINAAFGFEDGDIWLMKSYTQDFLDILDKIKPSKHRYEVFSDWLILASAALYAPWKKDKSVEEEYLQIAKLYNASELDKLVQLFVITVKALERNDRDFLGEVFALGELSNERNGQYFTPFDISRVMAEVVIGKIKCEKSHVIRINDPCCGAGGMLIACTLVLKERGINYQKDVLFVGTDIDHRCARMCYIQLSLLAAPAIIICGNTITSEIFWQRETMWYHISEMDYRLNVEKVFDLMTKKE